MTFELNFYVLLTEVYYNHGLFDFLKFSIEWHLLISEAFNLIFFQ
jgi:hypothetical protein